MFYSILRNHFSTLYMCHLPISVRSLEHKMDKYDHWSVVNHRIEEAGYSAVKIKPVDLNNLPSEGRLTASVLCI